MSVMHKIGMAELDVCTAPDAITTLGLGSCIGCVIYDSYAKICGMVHVILPDSTEIRCNEKIAKFADTGVRELLRVVLEAGANKGRLKAKIAGGAQMFAFNTNNEMLRVGERNAAAVEKALKELGVPLVAKDTGGNCGRTIEFYPEDCRLTVKCIGKSTYDI